MQLSLIFVQCNEWNKSYYYSPPFVGAHIRRAGKPRIKDEDTPECLTSSDAPQQGRIVTEPQTFPEPMDSVFSAGTFL